jgi:hypothetical protein
MGTYLQGEEIAVHDWTKINFDKFIYTAFRFNGTAAGPTIVINGNTFTKIIGTQINCIVHEKNTVIDEDLILIGNLKSDYSANIHGIPSDQYNSKYSFYFDGTIPDDYMEGSDAGGGPGALTGSMSLSTWVKHDVTLPVGAPDRIILDRANAGVTQGYALVLDDISQGRWSFYLGTGAVSRLRATLPHPPLRNVWYNVIGTWNTDTKVQSIYINGVLHDDTTLGAVTLVAPANNTLMGCANPPGTWPFTGNINNISIWDKELSPDEISELFNGGIPNNLDLHSARSNGVSWWKMGDGATWDGTSWTVKDLWGGTDVVSNSMGYNGRQIDTP